MAIAFMANVQHLALRQDVLEGAGITEAPGSYEEVLAAAEAIRAAGLMEHPLGANMKSGWDLAAEFVNMYLGLGGELFAPGSAELALDDAKAAQALEMMKALAAYMAPDSPPTTPRRWRRSFAQGRWPWSTCGLAHGGLPRPRAGHAGGRRDHRAHARPHGGGGAAPATTIWWDGFTIAANASDEDARRASRHAPRHRDRDGDANPDLAAWPSPATSPRPPWWA
jgi:hypothetical protein